MPLTNVSAYLTTNNAYQSNAYQSIVIPQTDTCISDPTDSILAEFYSENVDFGDWSGESISDRVSPTNIDNFTDEEIALLFGEIIHSRYC